MKAVHRRTPVVSGRYKLRCSDPSRTRARALAGTGEIDGLVRPAPGDAPIERMVLS